MNTNEETEKQADNKKETEKVHTDILEEIEVEDLTVDGICGVY